MNSTEAIMVIEQLQRRFARIAKRFSDSPALVQDWLEAMLDFDLRDVEGGIRDWVWNHNSEPTLKALMDSIEKNKSLNKRKEPKTPDGVHHLGSILDEAAAKSSPEDLTWVMLNIKMLQDGIVGPSLESRQKMAAAFRGIAEEYPELKADALREAELCVLEAGKFVEREGKVRHEHNDEKNRVGADTI